MQNKQNKKNHVYIYLLLFKVSDEGKSMAHCVYSYLSSCLKWSCSIFSLRLFGISMVTIEVRDGRAVQIRGPHNKRPTDKELSIIDNWAKKEFIGITKYAVAGR